MQTPDRFRIPSSYDEKRDRDIADPKSLDEAREWAEDVTGDMIPSVHPTGDTFDDDEHFFEMFESVPNNFWEGADVLFGGGDNYIDTVYVQYNDVLNVGGFREWMVLKFKHWIRNGPCEENAGICRLCDDRIETRGEGFRTDDELWAMPDEFSFEEHDEYGKYVRLWWD